MSIAQVGGRSERSAGRMAGESARSNRDVIAAGGASDGGTCGKESV